MQLTLPLAESRQLLGTYLWPQRGRVAVLSGLLLGSIGLQLVNPQIIRYFIDATQTHSDLTPLVYAGIAYIAISLAQRLLAVATTYLSTNVGWSATNALRSALTEHLLRLDMPFHKTHTPGELIERVDGDVTQLADFFSRLLISVVSNCLLIMGVLVLLFVEEWRAGLALSLYSVVAIVALVAVQGLGVRRWTVTRQASAEQFGYIEERVSGVEDIQGVGATAYVLGRLYAFTRRALKTRRSAEMVEYISWSTTSLLYAIGWALGLGIGAYLYTQGAITIGAVFVIVAYISMLAGPLDNLRIQSGNLQRSAAAINRVGELFRKRTDVRSPGTTALAQGALAVHFDDVSFAYADNEPTGAETAEDEEAGPDTLWVLRDVTFNLPAGRVLGVLGRTGSGKTTLTRLLFRLYDPTHGGVRLGDVDIRDVTLDSLRARVGMVTQDVQLFSASLRDNIAFFDDTVSEERITAALDALGLREWTAAMPQGLDTRLAAGGAGMSAGEAQMLAFTRLMLRDPGLIILDEAASRLDPITEQRLERAINQLLQSPSGNGRHRSAIIIAHRLSTVQRADDILILEGGRVIEYGPREKLANDPGSRFYSLLQTGLEEALA
jgi:ABC-type multidrug transport system fused ATPase/permease subunit